MNWLKRIFNTPPNKIIQGNNRNKAALDSLRALCFGPLEIRKALVELNRIRVKDLARQDGISAATIYNTIRGRRRTPKAMELVAASLELSVEDVFPKIEEPQACPPEAQNRQP